MARGTSIRLMEESQGRSRSGIVAAGVALALAAGAALVLSFADLIWFGTPSTGGPGLSLLYIAGWALMVWAVVIGIVAVAHVVHAIRTRRLAAIEIVLVVTTAAIMASVILARPLTGSSGGVAATLPSAAATSSASAPH
jgi:hypothetical protein